MQTYLVGGAVRDRLLGLEVRERDWVVVGSSPEGMRKLGYHPVGRSFPVYIHPKTREEYALARTETKTGHGYRGFSFRTDSEIGLSEDLRRRDLTINAMAEDSNGRVFDPYNGRKDLEDKILRHISDAFSEDPLRVLRVARFAARFATLGFVIADETMKLMTQMVRSGELGHLVAERVWTEMQRALESDSPRVFFEVLRECGALAVILPELDRLFGVPQPPKHHPEIDTGLHTMMALEQATRMGASPAVRFAVLMHDIGKGTTPKREWPRHRGHEERGVHLLSQLRERLPIPNEYAAVANATCRAHTLCHRVLELKSKTVLKLLTGLNARRKPKLLQGFLLACEADARGRTGFSERPYPQANYLRQCAEAVAAIKVPAEKIAQLSGKQISTLYHTLSVEAISAVARPA